MTFVSNAKGKQTEFSTYLFLPVSEGFRIDLRLLRLSLRLSLLCRSFTDHAALIGCVLGGTVVFAPLASNAGWNPIGRLRKTLVFGRGGEVIVLNIGLLVLLAGGVSKGLKGFAVHGSEVGRGHGGESARRRRGRLKRVLLSD